MQTVNNRKKHSRGIAIVLTTLTLSITLPLVGLGFDIGTLYLIKSKLSAAADSAALAGARALSLGATPSAQASNADSIAQNFFSGNFPTGYWNTSNPSASVVVDDTSQPNYRTVTVNATVQAPLYFLRVFRQTYSTINVSSQAGRRDQPRNAGRRHGPAHRHGRDGGRHSSEGRYRTNGPFAGKTVRSIPVLDPDSGEPSRKLRNRHCDGEA